MQDSVFVTTFVQKHIFASPPPPEVRRQLLASGYQFDGNAWVRIISNVCSLSPSEARHFIARDYADYSDTALAPGRTV